MKKLKTELQDILSEGAVVFNYAQMVVTLTNLIEREKVKAKIEELRRLPSAGGGRVLWYGDKVEDANPPYLTKTWLVERLGWLDNKLLENTTKLANSKRNDARQKSS